MRRAVVLHGAELSDPAGQELLSVAPTEAFEWEELQRRSEPRDGYHTG